MEQLEQLDLIKSFTFKIASWTHKQENDFVVTKRAERVPEVNELRREIRSMGVYELKYFEEGLDCIEYAHAARAAIVMGWTGFIDLLQNRIAKDNYRELNAILKLRFHGIYKKCSSIKDRDDLIKHFDDALLLEAGRKIGLFQGHVFKQLDAMRDERNNCAHVEEYAVTVRIALGFYAKLIQYLPYVL